MNRKKQLNKRVHNKEYGKKQSTNDFEKLGKNTIMVK